MKLMADLDGVIFPTYSKLNKLHLALFQEEINWQALVDKSNPYWQTKQGKWVLSMFNNDLFFAGLVAYKEAKETLRTWTKDPKNQIIYCTARIPLLTEATAYSLGRNNLPYGDLIFVERDNVARNKLSVVKMEGIDIAIDDEAEIILKLKDTCKTIIYTQPYNQTYQFNFRVSNWLEIHRILNT